MEKSFKELLFEKFLEWQKTEGEIKTQKDFADHIGISEASLNHIMSGRRPPSRKNVVARVLEDILSLENLLRIQLALKDEWRKFQREKESTQADDQKKLAKAEKQIRNFIVAIGDSGSTQALKDALHIAEAERDRLEYKLGHAPVAPAGLALTRISLEQTAASLRAKLSGDDLAEKKSALRQVISRVLVFRNDTQIRALIEYHLPETNIPPQSGGDISNSDSGPEGINSLLLIIPIRKYILNQK